MQWTHDMRNCECEEYRSKITLWFGTLHGFHAACFVWHEVIKMTSYGHMSNTGWWNNWANEEWNIIANICKCNLTCGTEMLLKDTYVDPSQSKRQTHTHTHTHTHTNLLSSVKENTAQILSHPSLSVTEISFQRGHRIIRGKHCVYLRASEAIMHGLD